MDLYKEIKKLKVGKVLKNVDMRDYTTYKAGGPAKCMVFVDSETSLINLLEFIKKNKIRYKVIGNCSNLVFSNKLFDGVLIKLSYLDYYEVDDILVNVGAYYNLTKLSLKMSKSGLMGLEWAVGIPGTVGGAIYMNAGAYKSDMGYIVSSVKVLTGDLEIKTIYNKEMNFKYRSSLLHEKRDYICLEANLVLKHGNKDELKEIIEDRKRRRLMSQPLEFPNAGSVFRNPEGDFAGRIVEALGYKGKGINDAIVSDKHANFIVNKGSANGDDIINLIKKIKSEVYDKTDIDLKVEQEFVE